MFHRLHARRHDDRGAAAVEFALVLPILVILVFGIIQYGIYFWSRQSAVAAAREAARRSSVGDYADCTSFKTFVKGELGGADTGVGSDPKRTIVAKGTGNTLTTLQPGDTMQVQVKYHVLNLGLLPLFNGGEIDIKTTSRVESVGATPLEACP